jgi:hypothetical protein
MPGLFGNLGSFRNFPDPMLGSSRKIALTCCVLIPLPLFGWWETGHQVIARIAAAHLTPAARTRVARILDAPDTPEGVADALAKASTWADEIKIETRTGDWHFIDLAIQDTKSDIPRRCKDNNCAPARIHLFAARLGTRTSVAGWSELDALRYLVHFVGDVHQPLHTISDADLGGNCEHLDPPLGKAKNLHALWDGELVTALDPNEKTLTAQLETEIESLSAARRHELAEGNQDDWTWESHELALTDVYDRLHIPVEPIEFPANCNDAPLAITNLKLQIQAGYIEDMKPVVRSQLEKAGLRLARLLNESL